MIGQGMAAMKRTLDALGGDAVASS
jgi:hypothetical protein